MMTLAASVAVVMPAAMHTKVRNGATMENAASLKQCRTCFQPFHSWVFHGQPGLRLSTKMTDMRAIATRMPGMTPDSNSDAIGVPLATP